MTMLAAPALAPSLAMRTPTILLILIVTSTSFAQATDPAESVPPPTNESQNTVVRFAAVGALTLGESESYYVDDPFDVWLDRDAGPVIGLAVMFGRRAFTLGGYLEYEVIPVSGDFEEDASGDRVGLGLATSGRLGRDDSVIGFEVDGSIGYAFASPGGDLDTQAGFDFGIHVGPCLSFGSYSLSITIGALYGYYSGGDTPEGIQNARTQVSLRLYRDL
jgi:hypothetical protein